MFIIIIITRSARILGHWLPPALSPSHSSARMNLVQIFVHHCRSLTPLSILSGSALTSRSLYDHLLLETIPFSLPSSETSSGVDCFLISHIHQDQEVVLDCFEICCFLEIIPMLVLELMNKKNKIITLTVLTYRLFFTPAPPPLVFGILYYKKSFTERFYLKKTFNKCDL